MTLMIPGIRERAISDDTAGHLEELLRFRHFKRYYFEFEYDWDRIAYVLGRFDQVRPLLRKDLACFREFLARLSSPTS